MVAWKSAFFDVTLKFAMLWQFTSFLGTMRTTRLL
jgi:hypothetical protein